jgi:hypothetical protein
MAAALAFAFGASAMAGQELSVTRLPFASDQTVRLENLATHERTERSGEAYFIVPPGRYSVQLLRDDRVVYQEVEYIGLDAATSRKVDPGGNAVVGLPGGNPHFESTVCSALRAAAGLAVASFGVREGNVDRRLERARSGAESRDRETDWDACATNASVDSLAIELSGSYGVSPLGMIHLAIEFIPSPTQAGRPRRPTNSLAPGRTLTPEAQRAWSGVVDDLKNGFPDVTVDGTRRPMLVCAASDASTPLFCQYDGAVAGNPSSLGLRSLYRFHASTVPVDARGVEDDHWTTFVGEDEYRATQEKLTADLQHIRDGLRQGVEDLEAKASALPGAAGAGQSTRSYPMAEMRLLVDLTQAEIDQALHDSTLQPLRSHFPQPVAKIADPSQPSVTEVEGHAIFRQLNDAVNQLTAAAGHLGVDLVFRTTPVETEGAQLSFTTCDRCRPIVSQGGEHRFYRGRYSVRAMLDGYVPYEGWMDITDDPKTILECEMVRTGRPDSGRNSSCSLKAQ